MEMPLPAPSLPRLPSKAPWGPHGFGGPAPVAQESLNQALLDAGWTMGAPVKALKGLRGKAGKKAFDVAKGSLGSVCGMSDGALLARPYPGAGAFMRAPPGPLPVGLAPGRHPLPRRPGIGSRPTRATLCGKVRGRDDPLRQGWPGGEGGAEGRRGGPRHGGKAAAVGRMGGR